MISIINPGCFQISLLIRNRGISNKIQPQDIIPAMDMSTLSPPVWVNTKHLLLRMVDELLAQKRVAVDTESNSLHAYREQVCLIQFSSLQADYLVDPLE